MRMLISTILILVLSSCAQITGQSSDEPSIIVAGLPDASCVLHSSGGWHQFCSAPGETVAAYDCGMRGGNHCWAVIGATHSEAYCIPPNTSGLECSHLVP